MIGLLRADGGVKLNLPPDTVFEAGDAVIAIALDNSELDVAIPAAGAIDDSGSSRLPRPRPCPTRRSCSATTTAPRSSAELADYAGPDSRVVVVADVAPERVALPTSNGLGVSYTQGSTPTAPRSTASTSPPTTA